MVYILTIDGPNSCSARDGLGIMPLPSTSSNIPVLPSTLSLPQAYPSPLQLTASDELAGTVATLNLFGIYMDKGLP